MQAQIERLEVHHLSSTGGALHYVLVSDAKMLEARRQPRTSPCCGCVASIADLNNAIRRIRVRCSFSCTGDVCGTQAKASGWDGNEAGQAVRVEPTVARRDRHRFRHQSGPLPPDIRYVITLDADTRLLHGTVRQMVGKMAHPLNRPVFGGTTQRVTQGYGVLQPRVTADLPTGNEGSIYQRIFSSPGGIDPYVLRPRTFIKIFSAKDPLLAKAYTMLMPFKLRWQGVFLQNTMLSHDLFEGVFARAALASDIEVVEDFPTRYDVDIRRHHRWVRGDWQLFPWIFGFRGAVKAACPRLAVGR